MTLLPPFTVDFHSNDEAQEFMEDLSDLLEGHLHGIDETSQIEFNGITFSMGKKGILALTPIISPDLLHCQESLYFYLKENGVKFKKTKGAFNPILPIGRFDFLDGMENGIEVAKLEFSTPFVMNALSFVLFEKTPQEWKIKNNLYDFGSRNHFFFVNELCLNH
jgi:hypothetical protein